MQLNLLPSSTRLLIQFDQQLRVFLRLWMVVGAIATTYLVYQFMLCRTAQERLARLDSECEPVRQLQNDIESQRQSLSKWQGRKTKLTSLEPPARPVTVLGSIVQSLAAQPGKVRLQRLSIQLDSNSGQSSNGTSPKPSTPVAPQRQSIVLMGQADDDTSLSQLIQDMQRVGFMNKVELKSSSRTSHLQTRQFHIEAWQDLPAPSVAQPTSEQISPQIH